MRTRGSRLGWMAATFLLAAAVPSRAQRIDKTTALNHAGVGIAKSLAEQIGAGRGDVSTPDSSAFLTARGAFREVDLQGRAQGRPRSA